MKERHVAGAQREARLILRWARVNVGQDFNTLNKYQVGEITKAADTARYQHPKKAKESRACKYYQILQRRAKGYK